MLIFFIPSTTFIIHLVLIIFFFFFLLCWVIFAPWAFFNCIKLGLLFIAMYSLLVVVASLVVDLGSRALGLQ